MEHHVTQYANGDLSSKIFWGCAALLLLFRLIRGWQLGIVRQLTQIFALIAGAISAFLFHGFAAPYLNFLGFPDFVNNVLAALIILLGVFLLVGIASSVLFKKTKQQEFSLIRFVYGVCGALLGLLFGIVIILIIVFGIRILGTISDGAKAEASASRPAAGAQRSRLATPEAPQTPLIDRCAKLKKSVDQSALGSLVEHVDPVPKKVYETADKIGRVASNHEAMQRFFNYPGLSEIAANPKIRTLLHDPEITEDLHKRDYLALLRNYNLCDAADDPAVQAALKKIDLQKALDYALKK